LVYEDAFLFHATSELAQSLASGQIMYVLQAHVLLGSYALARGNFLTGQNHVSKAASLARLSLNLAHEIPLTGPHGARSTVLDPVSLQLPAEALGQIDEGERVNAFWTIFSLEKIWGVALGYPLGRSGGGNGVHIQPPWSLAMDHCEKVRRLPTVAWRLWCSRKRYRAGQTRSPQKTTFFGNTFSKFHINGPSVKATC
jgi:hypothetical protein